MRSRLALLVGVLSATPAIAGRKSREVVLPDSWSWQVDAKRTSSSSAVGAGAIDMPASLSSPQETVASWKVQGAWGPVHPDGSLTELLRVEAPGDPMDTRIFGIRKFADGELLRIERLASAALGGLDSWDPILLALSPAMPEEVSAKRSSTRALQWTARVGSGVYFRSNCPAVWSIVSDTPPLELATGVQGGAEGLQHLHYEAHCGLNGRADLAGGRPVPFRGEGSLVGDVWWDPTARWVVRHELSLERKVYSRWPGVNGSLELIQTQAYTVKASRTPGGTPAAPPVPLSTASVETAVGAALVEWSACAEQPGPHAVTLEALHGGALGVRAAGPPPEAPEVVPDVGGLPQRGRPSPTVTAVDSVDDLSCWQAAVDDVQLPAHDDLGERFDFVLPRSTGSFGMPGVMDRALPTDSPRFIVTDPTSNAEVAAWLGVI